VQLFDRWSESVPCLDGELVPSADCFSFVGGFETDLPSSVYTLRRKLNLLLSEFAADLAPGAEWEPRFDIPPTASVHAVRLVGRPSRRQTCSVSSTRRSLLIDFRCRL
jgi:hypothetical protein